MRDFFTEGIFSPGISLQNFFPLKSVCTIFFSEITHTPPAAPLKSQMVGRPLNIPGIGIQNVIEVQKKNCSLLLDVNRSSQRTFKVRKSCVSQKSFLLPPLFILCGHSLMDPWKIYTNRQLKERRNGEEGWVWTSVNELVWLPSYQILVTGNNKQSV